MLETITEPDLDLVTLEAAKSALGITGTDSDDAVAGLVAQVSAAVQGYLGFPVLTGEYRETVEVAALNRASVFLSRWPVQAVASVKVNDVALEATGYAIAKATGALERRVNGRAAGWGLVQVVAEYTAGHSSTPADVEAAVFTLLRAEWASRSLDPNLRSISIGSIGLHYFAPDARPGLASVAHLLDPYRIPAVG